MVGRNIDNLKLQYYMEKCGMKNCYQYMSLIIIFLLYATSEFIAIALPLLEINPYISYFDDVSGKNITTQVNYILCNSVLKNNNYTILYERSASSLVTEFNIFCDENKVSFIGSSLFLGVMIGSFVSHYFSDKIGRKKTIIFFSILYSIIQFIYILNTNLYVFYFMLFLSGLLYSIIVLSSILLLNEVIDVELTAIFTTIIYNAYPLSGILFDIFFKELNDWKVIFMIIGITHIVVTIIFTIFIQESPRFYFCNKDLDNLKFSLEKIKSINKKDFDISEIDNIFSENENRYGEDDRPIPNQESSIGI